MLILKPSQFGLHSATRVHEVGSLVIADQHAAVNTFRALYTPPVTPWELVLPEAGALTARKQPTTVGSATGVKS